MDKQIYVIEENYKTSKMEIVAYDFKDFILDHADYTTTPNGSDFRLHTRQVDGVWQIWTWGVSGNHLKRYDSQDFATEEEAEFALFKYHEYYVRNSDQVSFFDTYEDAREFYLDAHCQCKHCSGTGEDYDEHSCSWCRGKGVVYDETEF